MPKLATVILPTRRERATHAVTTAITDTAVTSTAVVKVTEIANTTVVDSALNATQPAS